VVEVLEAGLIADFLLKGMDRAGGVDWRDRPTIGADEIVPVLSGDDEGEVSCAFVEAEAADEAVIGETVQKAIDGGLVTLGGKTRRIGQLGEHHGSVALKEGGEQFFQGTSAPEAGFAAALKGLGEGVAHLPDDTLTCPSVAVISCIFGNFPLCSRGGPR
jgi:hypothetical protein